MRSGRLAACVLAGSLAVSGCAAVGDLFGGDTPGRTPAPATPSAAPPSGADPALAAFYAQRVRWTPCEGDAECATVEVPLDYDAPAGERIGLAVLRVRASGDAAERIGSLLVNPGGPGGSGVDYARAARAVLSEAVRERFDVVGVDPRGVARSAPVDCVPDAELDAIMATDITPDDAGEVAQLEGRARALVDGCVARSGAVLPHVGTADAARDLDVVRAVLGDEGLHYLGKSYGTVLGARYAQMFPERVAAMVLDGALSPTRTAAEIAQEQAAAFEAAFAAFVADCVNGGECPLGPSVADATSTVDQLLALVDGQPLSTDQAGRPLTESLAHLGIVMPLYFSPEEGWPVLRDALAQALAGDGSGLLTLADRYLDRGADGRYSGNQNEAIYAVNCVDRVRPASVQEVRESVAALSEAAPLFGEPLGWGGLPCALWPVPVAEAAPVTAAGAEPILVIGTTGDPATPLLWAQELAADLESGRLLTYEQFVHTAYGTGSECVDEAVDAYLLDAVLPAEGTVCR